MFSCLKEGNKVELTVVEGMNFSINRRRFTLVDEKNEKSKREIIPLKATVISTKHPKFYLIEITSNYQNRSYIETYNKEDFQSRIQEQIITLH